MGLLTKLTSGYNDGGTSVEKEMKRAKASGWRDVIFCIVLVVIILIFFEDRHGIKPNIEMETFRVEGVADDSVEFRYEDLDSIELRTDLDAFDFGEKLEGGEQRKCRSGIYRNSEPGEYKLFVATNVPRYMVLRLSDGTIIVLSSENDETVTAMYNFLVEKSADAKAEAGK